MKTIVTVLMIFLGIEVYAGEFQKAEDSRCSFFHTIAKDRGNGLGGTVLDTEDLRKMAKAKKKGWDFNPNHMDLWYTYNFNSTNIQLKHVPAPPYFWGRMVPYMDDPKEQEKLFGKEGRNVMALSTTNGSRFFVKFPGKSKVPCGWIAVYFTKWKIDYFRHNGKKADPFYVIQDARFVPAKFTK
ncbi:MAG: hypothetical protein AB7F43_07800 [Bacteriovoracia bacterium]